MRSYLSSVRRVFLLLLFGLLVAALAPPPALGAQARSSAVTEWPLDCSGSTRDWWDDMCMAWRKELGSFGWSQAPQNYQNVFVSRYVDPSIAGNPWGGDNLGGGFDTGTASLLCTHGSYNNAGWGGRMHHKEHNECDADVYQLKFGVASGGSTLFLHLSSCNSMRWDQINTWFGPGKGGVHTITGFHGLMYIDSGYVDEYADMAFSGLLGSVAESWVINMHHDPLIGNTICPISMSFGKTKQAALNRLFGENYLIPSAEQPGNYGVLEWISECEPNGAGPLPE